MVLSASVAGGHQPALEALRDRLAADIDALEYGSAAVAPLSRQLAEVLRELAGMPSVNPVLTPAQKVADELAARRIAGAAS